MGQSACASSAAHGGKCSLPSAANVTAINGRWKLDNRGKRQVIRACIIDRGKLSHHSVCFSIIENGRVQHFQVDLLYHEQDDQHILMLHFNNEEEVDRTFQYKSEEVYFQASMLTVQEVCEKLYEAFGDYNIFTNNCQTYSTAVIAELQSSTTNADHRFKECCIQPSLLCMFLAPKLIHMIKRLDIAKQDKWVDRIRTAYSFLPDFCGMLFLLDDLRHTMPSRHSGEIKALERFINYLAPPMLCDRELRGSQHELSAWLTSKYSTSTRITDESAFAMIDDVQAFYNKLRYNIFGGGADIPSLRARVGSDHLSFLNKDTFDGKRGTERAQRFEEKHKFFLMSDIKHNDCEQLDLEQNALDLDFSTCMQLYDWLMQHRNGAVGKVEINALQQLVYAYTLTLSLMDVCA